jgi:hypothetical protein
MYALITKRRSCEIGAVGVINVVTGTALDTIHNGFALLLRNSGASLAPTKASVLPDKRFAYIVCSMHHDATLKRFVIDSFFLSYEP